MRRSMQVLHCADHNEPQVPVLNVRISAFHPKCCLRWEMPQEKDNQRVPKKIPWHWKTKVVYSVLQVIGDFFILHTRCEWKKFCIHEEGRIATARFRIKNNIKQHQRLLHQCDTGLMDLLFYADWIWLSWIVRLLSITIIVWQFPARPEEISFSVESINTSFFHPRHTLSILFCS